VILFRPFVLLTPNTFKLFDFPTFSTLIVLDEGYSRYGRDGAPVPDITPHSFPAIPIEKIINFM
jgi:hypothetical protein